jgi:hypothetical protein
MDVLLIVVMRKHASWHHPAWRPLVICPKNKPFHAETLKAEKQRQSRQGMRCAHWNPSPFLYRILVTAHGLSFQLLSIICAEQHVIAGTLKL